MMGTDRVFDRVRGRVYRDLQLLIPKLDLKVLQPFMSLIHLVMDFHSLVLEMKQCTRDQKRAENTNQ